MSVDGSAGGEIGDGAPSRISDSWSCTQIRSINHSHVWMVKGFSQCECRYLETSVKVDGPAQSEQSMTFRIRLHPQGNKESNKDFTFFQVFCNTNNASKYKAKFLVTNARNEEIATTVYTGTQQLHGYFEYIRRDLLVGHIQPSDELQLVLNLTITFDTITKSSQTVKTEKPTNDRTHEIARDLAVFFHENKATNFTINFANSDRSLQTHKAILTARSAVFAAMLEPHTEEYKNSAVTLEDIDQEVMHELLQFMYSGRSPNLPQMAPDLLAAADRFALPGLKEISEQVLRANLMVDSVCRTLVLADMHDARELKAEAIKFIAQNSTAVIATIGWSELVKHNSELVTQVVSAISQEPPSGRLPAPGPNMGILPPEPASKRQRTA